MHSNELTGNVSVSAPCSCGEHGCSMCQVVQSPRREIHNCHLIPSTPDPWDVLASSGTESQETNVLPYLFHPIPISLANATKTSSGPKHVSLIHALDFDTPLLPGRLPFPSSHHNGYRVGAYRESHKSRAYQSNSIASSEILNNINP